MSTKRRAVSWWVAVVIVAELGVLAGCATVEDRMQAPREMPSAEFKTPTSAGAMTEVPVEAPIFTVGDRWTFKTPFTEYTVEILEITANGGIVITRSHQPGIRVELDHHLTPQKVEGNIDPRLFIGWKFIDFPAFPKKQFSFKTQGTTAEFSVEVKMTDWEAVKVPAGIFRALRIESCWRNMTTNWSDCGFTLWYAPDVKWFVKRQTPST